MPLRLSCRRHACAGTAVPDPLGCSHAQGLALGSRCVCACAHRSVLVWACSCERAAVCSRRPGCPLPPGGPPRLIPRHGPFGRPVGLARACVGGAGLPGHSLLALICSRCAAVPDPELRISPLKRAPSVPRPWVRPAPLRCPPELPRSRFRNANSLHKAHSMVRLSASFSKDFWIENECENASKCLISLENFCSSPLESRNFPDKVVKSAFLW